MAQLSLNHISIPVSDLKMAVEFYKEIFDFETIDISDRSIEFSEKVTGIKGMILKIAYIKHDGLTLELIEYAGEHNLKDAIFSNKMTMNHFCLNINNIHSFYDQHCNTIEFINRPTEIFSGPNNGGVMAYLKDADGNKIELIQKPDQLPQK